MEFFLKNGVCFESDVILMSVTYGGVQTTGCHVSTGLIRCPMYKIRSQREGLEVHYGLEIIEKQGYHML